jgi:hypothetical protein
MSSLAILYLNLNTVYCISICIQNKIQDYFSATKPLIIFFKHITLVSIMMKQLYFNFKHQKEQYTSLL